MRLRTPPFKSEQIQSITHEKRKYVYRNNQTLNCGELKKKKKSSLTIVKRDNANDK